MDGEGGVTQQQRCSPNRERCCAWPGQPRLLPPSGRQALELLTRGGGGGGGEGGSQQSGGSGAQRERDLMRAVPEADSITCLCGTVRIQMAGMQAAKAAAKQAKKKGAK